MAGLPLASVMLMSITTLVIEPVPSLLVIVSVPVNAERVSVAVWSICKLDRSADAWSRQVVLELDEGR